MPFFTPDFHLFFKELAQNNQREWFEANKERYEKSVKNPFKDFVQKLINEIQNLDSEVRIEAKDCIFRINRDIRFAKDKTPYKLHTSAAVGKGGKKSAEIAGFYFEFTADSLTFASGAYQPDKNYLHKIRSEIQSNMEEFSEIMTDPQFVKFYGLLQGEKNKIIPKEFHDELAEQPLLVNKQFYGMVTHTQPELLYRADLVDFVLAHYQAALRLNRFLIRAYEY